MVERVVSDADTGKRRQVTRPRSQWIETEDESKRIVPHDLWEAVKRRQAHRTAEVGTRIAAGKRSAGGRAPRYLFSGLLRCECCGSRFIMSDKRAYSCSGYVNGRTCDNDRRVSRKIVESRLLAGIRSELLSEARVREFSATIRRRLASPAVDPHAEQRAALSRQIDNLAAAIADGLMSPTVRTRLQAAEAALAALPPPPAVIRVDQAIARLPAAVARYRKMVEDLGDAPVDIERSREALREILGEVQIAPHEGHLVAKMALSIDSQALACGRGSGGRI